jgi:hypothetical protein
MQSGNTGYVEEFFANRPEWNDQDEETTEQADNNQEATKKEERS